MSPEAPEVSVVVCSHNGGRTLPTAFAALEAQSLERSRFEMIAVDDGSTDDTLSIMRRSGAHVIPLSPNRGIAAARNAGVEAARAPLVAFTDDDCEPEPGWLAAVRAGFDDPSVVGLSGTVIPTGTDSFNIRYLQRHNPLVALGAELVGSPGAIARLRRYLSGVTGMRPSLRSGDDLYAAVGANMAFRREAILALGGFDEAYRFGAEEEELCIRLLAQGTGHRLAFSAEARVAHHFRPELGDSLRRSRSYGRGNARRAITHPDTRPIVYPFPLLVAVTALAAVARARSDPRRALVPALMPLALYPRWICDVRASRSPEPLAYPYVEMLQEIWTMRGEVDGYRARARTAAAEPAARPVTPRSTPAP